MRSRLHAALVPTTLLVSFVGVVTTLAITFDASDSRAELDNQVFTASTDRLRVLVPRGWRATENPTYPGLLLWMMRSEPRGEMVLTSETFTRELYCSWPIACRAAQSSPTEKYACAVRDALTAKKLRVGPLQPGPKENALAGLPSVWFEYDDGKRFLRHAIALSADRAVSLVLASPSAATRAQHVRAFDQTLRTVRILSVEEAVAATGPDAALASSPTVVDGASVVVDGGGPDAGATLPDAALVDAGIAFESAPAPRVAPIGPCVAPAR